MEQHVSERIKFLIDTRAKGNKSAFGRAVNLTPQAVMDILEAKSGPGFASLQKILKGYPDISSDWLIFGEGEMLKGQQPEGAGLTSGAAVVAESETLLKLAVAEATLLERNKQLADKERVIADKDRLIDRLWNMVPAKLGKLMSSLEAAGVFGGAGQLAGSLSPS